MRLAIIADPHCGQPYGVGAFIRGVTGRHDKRNGRRLAQIVDRLNELTEVFRLAALGDITHRGMPQEYREAQKALMRYKGPVFLVPGNHDTTDAKRMGLGFSMDGLRGFESLARAVQGESCYPMAIQCEGYRLLLVDSSAHGERGTLFARGRIGNRQLAWLASELADPRPTVVAMHHYPEKVNPTLAVEDAEALMTICARDHVTIINGHRHREGEYPRTQDRPEILTHGQCVESGRVRILDPASGEWEWLEVGLG